LSKGCVSIFSNYKKPYKTSGKSKSLVETISSDKLFDNYFMRKNTKFLSFSDFLRASGVDISSQHKFEALTEHELDAIVLNHTEFKSWKDMLNKATEPYALKKLKL
jgi:hypothetical protein